MTTAIPLHEFDQEVATTRKLLERVPGDKGAWKPHQKSFPLGHLAQLLSWMPGWITKSLATTELNLAEGSGYSLEATEELLRLFDRNVAEARRADRSNTARPIMLWPEARRSPSVGIVKAIPARHSRSRRS